MADAKTKSRCLTLSPFGLSVATSPSDKLIEILLLANKNWRTSITKTSKLLYASQCKIYITSSQRDDEQEHQH